MTDFTPRPKGCGALYGKPHSVRQRKRPGPEAEARSLAAVIATTLLLREEKQESPGNPRSANIVARQPRCAAKRLEGSRHACCSIDAKHDRPVMFWTDFC